MKSYIYKGIAVIMMVSLFSCKKVLDTQPAAALDGDQAFKTIDDYEFLLTGAYSRFRSANYYGSTGGSNAFACLPDIMSDNLFESNESLGNYQSYGLWDYPSDDGLVEATWTTAYFITAQANKILKGIDKFAATNPGAVNRIKSQALAIRALTHFDLMRYWVNDYDRNSTQPGIPYVETDDFKALPSRGTVKNTYDKIERDLMQAKTLMQSMDRSIQSKTSEAGTARSYIDEIVVDAILARMYLYANKMDEAIQYSTSVINQRPLAEFNEYPGIWTDDITTEVIWSYKFETGQSDVGGNVYYVVGDRSSFFPTRVLLNLYDRNNDIRFFTFFYLDDPVTLNGRRVVTKYYAKSTTPNPDGIVNFKAFRTSEMYLIRAEAYARKNQDNLGLADLNTLRSKRIDGFTPGTETGAALLTAIQNERRKELFCEGHRFFDMKRTDRSFSRIGRTGVETLLPSSRSWNFPIPQKEIDANANIKPQNPGY